MTLTEAYDYIDVLLDKADQPYFIKEEKDKFLNLAISDFVSMHYEKMHVDEDSRRAISGCVDYNSWDLSTTEILSGLYLYGSNPSFSAKYDDTTSTDNKGFWKYGNQYVLPKQHLYVFNIGVGKYNRDEVLDNTGMPFPGVTDSDIKYLGSKSATNKSVRDFYQTANTNDPFNESNDDNTIWAYVENKIIFTGVKNIKYVNMQTLTIPTVEQAFSAATFDSSTAPTLFVFAEHYQKQIVQVAVKRMTQTDIGLMTPPQ